MRRFVTIFAVAALTALLGCPADPPAVAPPERAYTGPRVRPIRPDIGNTENVRLFVDRLYLPLDADLADAWQHVETEGFDADVLRAWRGNGLLAGTCNPVEMGRFLENLPPRLGRRIMNLSLTTEQRPIELAPPISQSIELRWVDPDKTEPRTMRLPPGRMQLLAQIERQADSAEMALAPHHHWVKPSLLPRTPQETAMEGYVFEELALSTTLSDDRYLLIGYIAPAKAPEAPQAAAPAPGGGVQGDTAPSDQAGEAVNDAHDSPQRPAPPGDESEAPRPPRDDVQPPRQSSPRLGTLLLTAEHLGKPVQIVVIMRIPVVVDRTPQPPDIRPDVPTTPPVDAPADAPADARPSPTVRSAEPSG